MLKKDPVLKEKIVAFINSFYREERRSPSFQEIGSCFNINKTTAYRYILEMKNEGMVGYEGIFCRLSCQISTDKSNNFLLQLAHIIQRNMPSETM